MGAYLTSPVCEKETREDANQQLTFAASSMQGWRMSQEDAHNAILNFDEKTSFFAVYDGHGGSEIAVYCSKYLPDFIKNLSSYQDGNLRQALIDSFLQFDAKLLDPEVKKILVNLAECVETDEEHENDEAELLKNEAQVPIEELVKDENCLVTETNSVQTTTSLLRYLVSDNTDELDDDDEDDESFHESDEEETSGDEAENQEEEEEEQEETSDLIAVMKKSVLAMLKKKTEDKNDDDDDNDENEEEEENQEEEMIDVENDPGSSSGCTAVVTLVRDRELFVANAGDSRCVVCRNGQAVEMSIDHKPEDPEERQRIVKAGYKVTSDGRVSGGLNLSRAIGDHAYKKISSLPAEEQAITALPDIRTLTLDDDDEFMVIACDGIWNFMPSQDVIDFVRLRLEKKSLSQICEELFMHCLAPSTHGDGTGCDNMTAIIVKFHFNHSKRTLSSSDNIEENSANKKFKN